MSEVGGDEGRLGAGTACQSSAILAATPPRQSRGSAIGTVERLHGINFNNGRIGNPVREIGGPLLAEDHTVGVAPDRRCRAHGPKRDAVLDEIELRVAVELGKRQQGQSG
jgi:hypothetical protein